MSQENDWVASFVPALNERIQVASRSECSLKVDALRKMPYALEVLSYVGDEPHERHISRYETDLLIYEQQETVWFPRVIIECKLGSVTTHDALTYSAKAATHKHVHPYLRYGILLGEWGQSPLPGRLVRHGAHFDFMATWHGKMASDDEWNLMVEVLRSEIEASRHLQDMLTNRKKSKAKYAMLHRRLVLHTTGDRTSAK
jgi:hypothetical protein